MIFEDFWWKIDEFDCVFIDVFNEWVKVVVEVGEWKWKLGELIYVFYCEVEVF